MGGWTDIVIEKVRNYQNNINRTIESKYIFIIETIKK